MEDISSVVGNYSELFDLVFKNLKDSVLGISGYRIDHIAYRASTKEEYTKIKDGLTGKFGVLLTEKIIRNRPVAILKLFKPLRYEQYIIPCFEILAPAEGDRQFKRKLEHLEVVVGDDFSKLISKFPTIEFNTKNMDKEINPELILNFPNDANVKFHPLSIEEVIELEK